MFESFQDLKVILPAVKVALQRRDIGKIVGAVIYVLMVVLWEGWFKILPD
jgi:hypothetical protein